jgi:DNA (cytosine-5)-methyltransferase 1
MVPRGGRLWNLYEGLVPATLARLQAQGVVPTVPFKQKGQRLSLYRPSPTLTSHSEGELVHPARNRCLSVRESARLQSFPDCHAFAGPLCTSHEGEDQDMYEQVGDAVPPLLAWSLGMAVRRMLAGVPEERHPLSVRA